MKRQRNLKVHPGRDSGSEVKEHSGQNVKDLWLTPHGYHRNDLPEGGFPISSQGKRECVAHRVYNHGELREKTKDKENSIQLAVKPFIFLGQCFGLIPVQGFTSSSPDDVRFKWGSSRVLYTVVLVLLSLLFTVLQVYSAATVHGFSYLSLDNIFTTSMTTTQLVIFLQQARTWPALLERWTRLEERMSHFRPLEHLATAVHRLVYAFCVCSCFLVMARLVVPLTLALDCIDSPGTALHLALLAQYNALPLPPGLTPLKTLLISALFLLENLVLVFDELTLMVLAYALYLRFRQLNYHLQKVCRQRLPVQYWGDLRVTYNSLSHLADHLNTHLSWMTLVCFGASLYDICSLLHALLSPENNATANWALFYELLFAVLRTFAAALVASSVGEESKKPLHYLFSVPSESYSGEVCRFQMQVTHGDIAITGLNFFSVTRSFMLTVAGTIVTYEIVLIQFGATNNTVSNSTEYCNNMLLVLE